MRIYIYVCVCVCVCVCVWYLHIRRHFSDVIFSSDAKHVNFNY